MTPNSTGERRPLLASLVSSSSSPPSSPVWLRSDSSVESAQLQSPAASDSDSTRTSSARISTIWSLARFLGAPQNAQPSSNDSTEQEQAVPSAERTGATSIYESIVGSESFRRGVGSIHQQHYRYQLQTYRMQQQSRDTRSRPQRSSAYRALFPSRATQTATRIRRLVIRPCVALFLGLCFLQAFFASPAAFNPARANGGEMPWDNGVAQRFKPVDDQTHSALLNLDMQHPKLADDMLITTMGGEDRQYAHFDAATLWQSDEAAGEADHEADEGIVDDESSTSVSSSVATSETSSISPPSAIPPKRNHKPQHTLGWDPMTYPDPIVHPLECGIAYLKSPYDADLPPQSAASPPLATLPTNQTDPLLQRHNEDHLRLCDPDWVLGSVHLNQIAAKLRNFSATFTEEFFSSSEWNGKHTRRHRRLGQIDDVNDMESSEDVHESISLATSTGESDVNNDFNSDSDGGSDLGSSKDIPSVELAVATVRKMDIANVLNHGSYFTYEDEDDMVSDAAQIFARYLHEVWWHSDCYSSGEPNPEKCVSSKPDYGILIFLSIQDRVCFISTGSAVSVVLPWWRLEHIIASMKPDLRHRNYGKALLTAIDDLAEMLKGGPPTIEDRLHDFLSRFGVVIGFAIFTFCFGAWGEYRDRRKRWKYAENRSLLSAADKKKARLLQKEFKTFSCPICLEPFKGQGEGGDDSADYLGASNKSKDDVNESNGSGAGGGGGGADTTDDSATRIGHSGSQNQNDEQECNRDDLESNMKHNNGSTSSCKPKLRRVDTYGIPLHGSDDRRIKMLRCGHIFCDTCWMNWVHSGYGNPCFCPVCRQDIGKSSNKRRRRNNRDRNRSSNAASSSSNTNASTSRADSNSDNGNSNGSGNNNADGTQQNGATPTPTSFSEPTNIQTGNALPPSYDSMAVVSTHDETSHPRQDDTAGNRRATEIPAGSPSSSTGSWPAWFFAGNFWHSASTSSTDGTSSDALSPSTGDQAGRRDGESTPLITRREPEGTLADIGVALGGFDYGSENLRQP